MKRLIPIRYLLYLPVYFLFPVLCLSQNIELTTLKTLNQGHYPAWDKTMNGISWSAYAFTIAEPVGVWSYGHYHNDKEMKRNAFKSLITIGSANIITLGLKYAVNRPRPYVTYPNDIIKRSEQGPYSFPSGHTAAAFSTATALSLSAKKWWVTVPAYTYAGLIGYSRMRLGAHYPGDVLAGILIGITSGILTWQIDKFLYKN
ncbi:MAG: phosphatase PAP2 family protein [Sediminibacterium sp.]|nr:phosphatase PAP2 family protein [Sediminibacterium sp.]